MEPDVDEDCRSIAPEVEEDKDEHGGSSVVTVTQAFVHSMLIQLSWNLM